jgi:hypothetical protein
MTKVDHKLMRLAWYKLSPPKCVDKKIVWKQVHNYKLVGQGSFEHIMQGGSLKDKR